MVFEDNRNTAIFRKEFGPESIERNTHKVKYFMEIRGKYVRPFPACENLSGSSKFAFQ